MNASSSSALSSVLAKLLEQERLPHSLLQTIAAVYEPLAARIASSASHRLEPVGGPFVVGPFVVGLCGPQGSGKSTMTAILAELLRLRGLAVAVLSLDDLYLSRSEREQLANRIHPLLRTRGVPGTHDVPLGLQVLDALSRVGNTALPSFDKATDDRRAAAAWQRIPTPVDIVLFEGWFVGATPQQETALATPANDLERNEDAQGLWRTFVNDALRDEYQRLFERIDLLVLLQATNFDVVYRWRAEQEQKLRERLEREGINASKLMDQAALRRFIAHYERLTRHVMEEIPTRADIVIEIDEDRVPRRVSGLE
jgi:D-glycerate 3-kinase